MASRQVGLLKHGKGGRGRGGGRRRGGSMGILKDSRSGEGGGLSPVVLLGSGKFRP